MTRRAVARCVAVATGVMMLAASLPMGAQVAFAGSGSFAIDEDVVYAATPADGETFGSAVAIDGDTMVVGVPQHATDAGLTNAGVADVYVRSGADWVWQATLVAGGAIAAEDRFGTAVAISGDRIVVGCPGRDSGAGASFVYARSDTAWPMQATLQLAAPVAGDRFGAAVDIDGDTIVVGAPGADAGRGSVMPYAWSGSAWVPGVAQTTPGGAADGGLGACVSLSGDTFLASARDDDIVGGPSNVGSISAFVRSGGVWAFEQRWFETTPVAGERFGASIDLQAGGYAAVVGSPQHDVGAAADQGVAYLYVRSADGWQAGATLAHDGPNSAGGDQFGSSVAFDGHNLILVGAPNDDDAHGAAYYYQYRAGVWNMAQKIDWLSTACSGRYGASVALDGGRAAVGGPTASGPAG